MKIFLRYRVVAVIGIAWLVKFVQLCWALYYLYSLGKIYEISLYRREFHARLQWGIFTQDDSCEVFATKSQGIRK